MTQTVISAPPRTGKTLYVVEQLEAISRKEPNRMIYTNVIGIQLPGVISIRNSINKPFDWRDLPNGSVLVYDEAHEHPAFSKIDLLKTHEINTDFFDNEVSKIIDYQNLNKEEKHKLLTKHKFQFIDLPDLLKVKEQEQLVTKVRAAQKMALEKSKEDILDIGRSLTLHGHFGIDIFLITQKPDLLNSYVRAATSEHLILRRLFKLSFAIIYSYAEVQEQFGSATRKNALSWRLWFYPKKLYKYYISAESHPSKPKIPIGITAIVALFLMLIGYSYFNTSNSDAEFFAASKVKDHKEEQKTKANVKEDPQNSEYKELSSTTQENKDITDLCRMGANVDTPVCKKFFDDLTKSGGSIRDASFNYDPSKPYSSKPQNLEYEATVKPVFSGCVKYGSKYVAYTQQGTIIHDVKSSDCKRLIEQNDRPFNYFKNDNQNANFNTQVNSTNAIQQNTEQHIQKEVTQANNYVESQFQSRNITGANAL